MSKLKILVVIVNYGDEQLNYLEQMIIELKSFVKYQVDIIVNSNIDIDIPNIDHINIYKLDNFQLLPLTCREIIWNNRNNYDLFIYSENDHLFKEIHVDKHIEYSNILPHNKIPGLIQYEEDFSGKYYPAFHGSFNWNLNSVKEYNNKKFAHFNNVHQASFIITRQQLIKIGKKIDFTKLVVDKEDKIWYKFLAKVLKKMGKKINTSPKYSVKCKVNTDIYLYAGFEKVICISEFEDNLIHHLPNLYINGDKGRKKLRANNELMTQQLKKMLD